jgi:phosphopentomutase
MLILTADQGNDPTDESTDHTREYVPVLCYIKTGKKNINLGVRSSFADDGKTVAEFFNAANAQSLSGCSFLSDIL